MKRFAQREPISSIEELEMLDEIKRQELEIKKKNEGLSFRGLAFAIRKGKRRRLPPKSEEPRAS